MQSNALTKQSFTPRFESADPNAAGAGTEAISEVSNVRGAIDVSTLDAGEPSQQFDWVDGEFEVSSQGATPTVGAGGLAGVDPRALHAQLDNKSQSEAASGDGWKDKVVRDPLEAQLVTFDGPQPKGESIKLEGSFAYGSPVAERRSFSFWVRSRVRDQSVDEAFDSWTKQLKTDPANADITASIVAGLAREFRTPLGVNLENVTLTHGGTGTRKKFDYPGLSGAHWRVDTQIPEERESADYVNRRTGERLLRFGDVTSVPQLRKGMFSPWETPRVNDKSSKPVRAFVAQRVRVKE